MRSRYRITALIFPLACILLSACQGESGHTAFERYLSRLSTTLGVEVPQYSDPDLPQAPRSGSLKVDITGNKLDALDFLALHDCELQVTISKRNSSLGRFARDSQRLLLELEFLRLAPACIEHLKEEDKAPLAALLRQAWEQKREQLPKLIFNATLGSDEFRYFWQTSKRLGTYPAVGDGSVVDSLNAIDKLAAQWLSGDYQANNLGLELHLGKIAGGSGGELWKQLASQNAWLAGADEMLAQRRTRGPLCGKSIRHKEADILPNVVRRFFVEGIQPRAAILNNRQYQMYTPIRSLEVQLHDTLPNDYVDWQRLRESSLREINDAPKRHVRQLIEIQRPCENNAS